MLVNIKAVIWSGCETWALALKEEHILTVCQNQKLGAFGPKRDEVTGGWSKLLSEELHNLYSSSRKIRMKESKRMIWTGHVARIGKNRCEYRILVRKQKKRGHYKDLDICGKLKLKCKALGNSLVAQWPAGAHKKLSCMGLVYGACSVKFKWLRIWLTLILFSRI